MRDSQGRITSITDPNGNSIIYAYSPSGDLASVTDRDGNVTSFGYSPSQPHFLTQITDGLGNVVMSGQYNTSGRLTQITNATGSSYKLSYNLSNLSAVGDGAGEHQPDHQHLQQPRACSRKSIDANNNETDYTYNGMFLASKTQVVGGTDLTTTYTTNSYGQASTQTDPSNNTTYYSYDQFGDPLTETDSLGDTTSFNYYFDPGNPNDPLNGDLLSTTDPLTEHDLIHLRQRGRCAHDDHGRRHDAPTATTSTATS